MDTDRCGTEILSLGLSPEPVSTIRDWNVRIWRYMDLAKFVSMLPNGALYFPVVAKLGDDLEAAPPRLPKGASPLDEQKVFSLWSLTRCITFANCWHCGEHESAAMWEIYAGRHQGVAIQSTLKTLLKAFPAATEEGANTMLKIGPVEYVDREVQQPLPFMHNLYQAVLRKGLWYSYEREVRLLCTRSDNWVEPASMDVAAKFKRLGVWVRCDLREIVQDVVVAPKSPPYFEAVVGEVFKRFGFDPARVKRSRLDEAVAAPNSDAVVPHSGRLPKRVVRRELGCGDARSAMSVASVLRSVVTVQWGPIGSAGKRLVGGGDGKQSLLRDRPEC